MARKDSLSSDNLIALGSEKLAKLVLDEAQENAPFRKRVKAALVGTAGAGAVAAMIDRRLAALEKARSMVSWEKERQFAAELDATVDTIVSELGSLSAAQAVRRLIRFIASHSTVFERIDDSRGRIQDVYWRAAEAVPGLVQSLTVPETADVPGLVTGNLSDDTHGLTVQVAISVIPILSADVLEMWEEVLGRASGNDDAVVRVRQAIAEARRDIDAYISLEQQRPEWRQNPLRVAELLLAANRLKEALQWVRREHPRYISYATSTDIADQGANHFQDIRRVTLEARILEAGGDRAAAQSLRWSAFDATLHIPTLRDYLHKLEDFIEREEEERAFGVAESFADPHLALSFFIEWPQFDRAARLVVKNLTKWNGRHYAPLGEAAVALEPDHPLASSILYRTMLDDILARAKVPAYGHGARHLKRLEALSDLITDWGELDDHTTYSLSLRKAHGRKIAFWSKVDAK